MPTLRLATICLYGTRAAGFTCLGSTQGRNGHLRRGFNGTGTFSTASLAICAMRDKMIREGVAADSMVSIHFDDVSGAPNAALAVLATMPTFGELSWTSPITSAQIESMGTNPGDDDHPLDVCGFDRARMFRRAQAGAAAAAARQAVRS